LVYIRETEIDEILLPVTAEDTPAHLRRLPSFTGEMLNLLIFLQNNVWRKRLRNEKRERRNERSLISI
jgi:hypothetical protein